MKRSIESENNSSGGGAQSAMQEHANLTIHRGQQRAAAEPGRAEDGWNRRGVEERAGKWTFHC